MIRTRAREARPLAALAVLATVAMLASACGPLGRELEPGAYRAVLELPAPKPQNPVHPVIS